MKNVGVVDQTVRVVVGLALLSVLVLAQGPIRWVGVLGLIPLLTGFARSCPLYRVFGVSTCRRREQHN